LEVGGRFASSRTATARRKICFPHKLSQSHFRIRETIRRHNQLQYFYRPIFWSGFVGPLLVMMGMIVFFVLPPPVEPLVVVPVDPVVVLPVPEPVVVVVPVVVFPVPEPVVVVVPVVVLPVPDPVVVVVPPEVLLVPVVVLPPLPLTTEVLTWLAKFTPVAVAPVVTVTTLLADVGVVTAKPAGAISNSV
jgi:hypothetical protein